MLKDEEKKYTNKLGKKTYSSDIRGLSKRIPLLKNHYVILKFYYENL